MDMFQRMQDKLQRNIWISNIVCTIVLTCYNILLIFFMTQPCWGDDPMKFTNEIRDLTTVMFTLLGVTFFCVGVMMNLSLKKYFPNFYDTFSGVLWLACFLLTLPLLFRAIINFSLNRSESFATWWSANFTET